MYMLYTHVNAQQNVFIIYNLGNTVSISGSAALEDEPHAKFDE